VRQWTVYGVNAKRWARNAGVQIMTTTCRTCALVKVLDIPFVIGEMRGLRSISCGCNTGGPGYAFTVGFGFFGKAPKRKRSRRKCRVFQFPNAKAEP
jgi:hypothetical protein